MKIAQKIQRWFREEGSYIEGVSLLSQCGVNCWKYQQYFQNDYLPAGMMEQLQADLTPFALAAAPIIPENIDETIGENSSENSANNEKEEQKAEPDEILLLRAQARQLHKRQSYLHAKLSLVSSDEDRLAAALEIMTDVIPKLDAKYDAIREWQATGKLPGEAKVKSDFQRGVEAVRRLNSLNSRISRLKGRLKKFDLTVRERQDFEQELADKELEKAEIEGEIG